MATDRAPVYLSARSADVILSEIRPTRLKADALQSINAFLDELLFLILQTAKSLAPIRLKDGFLKLLPTPLGKEAILEAEVELRNHKERTNQPSADDLAPKDFSIQLAFELLRIKCEACTTLNEVDEDAESEARLLSRSNGALPFRQNVIAPAVYYLTALLEHICQHILSNVGRVVARDSSRTVAQAHDLYIGLCEDETIYPLFSQMKIYETVNAQSSLGKSRRSKSISQSNDFTSSRTTSPTSSQIGTSESRPRVSETATRSSFDKTRALKMFRGSTGGEQSNGADSGNVPPMPHKRSQSQVSRKLSLNNEEDRILGDDDSLSQDFDELMMSGQTMKFSLTPDRLQSMEAFNKQKGQRANLNSTQPAGRKTQAMRDLSASGSPPPSMLNGRGQRSQVTAIDEGAEDSSAVGQPNYTKRRSQSLSQANSSQSTMPLFPPRSTQYAAASAYNAVPSTMSPNFNSQSPTTEDDVPNHKTNGVARKRNSLDDIMNGIDQKSTLTPKNATVSSKNDTRDLIDFLQGGPPDQSLSSGGPVSAPTSPDGFRKSGGRFRSMVTKLRNRTSSDRLRKEDEVNNNRPPAIKTAIADVQPYPRPPRYPSASTPPSAFPAHDMPKEVEIQPTPTHSRANSSGRKAVPEYQDVPSSEEDGRSTPQTDTDGVSQPKVTSNHKVDNFVPSPVSSPVLAPDPKPRSVARPPAAKINRQAMVLEPGDVPVAQSAQHRSGSLSPPIRSEEAPSTLRKKAPSAEVEGTSARVQAAAPAAPLPRPKPMILPNVTQTTADELRNLLQRAETASECRVLVDMFFAQSGLPSPKPAALTSSEPVDVEASKQWSSNSDLQVMELLLGS